MKTKKENYTISDTINFKSGVELGYSLGTWNEDPEVLKSMNALVSCYTEHPFCRGLKAGFERAQVDKIRVNEAQKEERMNEVFNIHNQSREQKDLER